MDSSGTTQLSAANVESALSGKDQIIAALTAQLEETAEKLDRIQRSGGALRTGSSGSLGLNSRANEQLEAFLEDWEAEPPRESLSRIELGIDRILRMIGDVADPNPVTEPQVPSQEAEQPTTEDDDEFWAAAKARLMGEGESGDGDSDTAPEAISESVITEEANPSPDEFVESSEQPVENSAREEDGPSGTESNSTKNTVDPESIEIPPVPDPPTPVEAGATLETLQGAIEHRDRYIQYLIARMRKAELTHWDSFDINTVPEDEDGIKVRVLELHELLTDHLKQSEIANSLERASLTRERAKLTQIKQQLADQIRRMGNPGDAATNGKSESNDNDKDKDKTERRWARLFGS